MKTILFLLVLCNSIFSQQIFKTPLSERTVSYDISVKLDEKKKMLDGYEILRWKNTSPDVIKELQFHLYLNAFKNINSTFMKESGGEHRGFGNEMRKKINWGWIDINSIDAEGQGSLIENIDFIQPDDSNKFDQTVVSIKLNKPLLPNKEIVLKIKFAAKLPKIFARTGFANDFYLVAQWFPKIGVYEHSGMRGRKNNGWNCHQFHSNSEFYADFAVYDVQITLPSKFVVGAVGSLISEKKNVDKTKTYHYHAEDVVDFAFTASPNYREIHDKWKHVDIKLLLQPEHFLQADRHFKAVKYAMDFFEKNLGEYPYSTLTIVDPPLYAMGAGGMEYPTFITAGCLWGVPKGMNFTEMVTVHEFGHNYFMGILASNEFEEAFLDEGFNQYFETRIMDKYYGKHTSYFNFMDFNVGDFEITRSGYTDLTNPKLAPINIYSWNFKHGGYGAFTYKKTAVVLKTLEGMIGEATMNEVMKKYYNDWKFKHPTFSDFKKIVDEIVIKNHGNKFGENLEWYFDQAFDSTIICDYKLDRIRNEKLIEKSGVYDEGKNKKFIKMPDESKKYRSWFIIHRLGEFIMPCEIEIVFSDKTKKTVYWDGKARSKSFDFVGNKKIISAEIDPKHKNYLDVDLINNSLAIENESNVFMKYTANFIFWFENLLTIAASLF